MKRYLIFLFVLGMSWPAFGQHIEKDSLPNSQKKQHTEHDGTLYKKIKTYSQKSTITRWLHELVFRSTSHHPAINKKHSFSPEYALYEGKIIRNITLKTTDPFGYAIDDTTQKPDYWLQKWGNAFHVKSKGMAIRKYLLFKKNQPLDSLLMYESTRLLREQPYVRKVRMVPTLVGKEGDSLDILVKILDSWSLIGDGSIDATHMKGRLRERNFIGLGHQLELNYAKRFSDGSDGYGGIYSVPNINNSFINLTAKYAVNFDEFYDKFIYVHRDFYSSLTRWAGGVLLQKRSLENALPTDSLSFRHHAFAYDYQDYWGGYAFHIFKGNSKTDRTTNLILSLRTFFLDYQTLPSLNYDSTNYFSDEKFYLGSVGLATRQYVTDRYIFRDGEIEDIPIGAIYSLTAGMQHKNNQNRWYLGARAAYGDYFNWGFFSANLEAGSFFHHRQIEQTTISFKANYFSHLLSLGGGWKMRQFIKPMFVLGFNRLNSIFDRVELNENPYFKGINSSYYIDYLSKKRYIDYKNGNIFGFKSPVSGTRKYVLDLQTQFYAPWSVWGFRLNPFLRFSLGYLSGGKHDYINNKLYSSLGIGVIIRNDYLVFGSFQLSLSYYPSVPGTGHNIVKTNSFSSGDYGFQSFELGEPHPVIYE